MDTLNLSLKLDTLGPLSAAGFFPVQKETFTALVGGAVSYLVLLVQLRINKT